jgi:hypothetical protein
MRYTLAVLILTCVVACRDPKPASGRQPDSSLAAGTRSALAAREQPYCMGDTSPRFPDPGKLVREFLVRDGKGEFLSSSPFWLAATQCAGEGTDYATVIASYSVDSLGVAGDTARFAVTQHFLGELIQGSSRFSPHVHTAVDTFVLVHRRYGWRIVGDHDLPVLLIGAAKAQWPLTKDDSISLDSTARESSARVVPN